MKLLVFFVLVTMFFSGCVTDSGFYYEIVHERNGCDPYCSLEYILLSNGTMMKKLNLQDNYDYEIKVAKIDSARAEEAIKNVEDLVSEYKETRCSNCNEYTLLMQQKGKSFMHITEEENSDSALKEILEDSALLFSEGEQLEPFFVQFVYKRLGQNAVDYHIFPNGSVLREEFVGDSQVLGPVEVFEITEEKAGLLEEKFDADFFDSETGLSDCHENGLEYGYLQLMKGDSYAFFWVCGTGDSRADKVFNELLMEFD